MADIDIGAISEALNNKTDRNMRNVDTGAKADSVIDYQEPTAENGYTWYRKYASGWVEQGGALPITNSRYITYPIAMNYPYVPVFKLCTNRSSASYDCELYPTEVTETQFYAYNTAPSGGNKAEWQVCGKSA